MKRMSRDETIELRASAPALRAEGVRKLAIVGSRARGDARPDSDLDVLIEAAPDAKVSLLNLSGVALTVEAATGLHTQVSMRRSLDSRVAECVADDVIGVFSSSRSVSPVRPAERSPAAGRRDLWHHLVHAR